MKIDDPCFVRVIMLCYDAATMMTNTASIE